MGSDKVYTQAEVDGLMTKAYEQGVLKVQDSICRAYNNQPPGEDVTGKAVIIIVQADNEGEKERVHILTIPIPDCSGGKCEK